MADSESHFDASRAELFEALGHPVRVKILHVLEARSMGFAELKREVGIESSGHLQFHLGKLSGLVGTTADGSYALTEDGREAIRVLNMTSVNPNRAVAVRKTTLANRPRVAYSLVVGLLIVVVVLSGVIVYQQQLGAASSKNTGTNSGVSTFALPVSLCTSIPPPTNQSTTDVYQIGRGSVSAICVNYLYDRAGTATFTPSYGPYSAGEYQACGFAKNGTAAFTCPEINIVASQYSYEHSANASVTVAYTIITARNVTGTWWFFIGPCEAIPLVFGPAPTSIGYPFFGCVTSTNAPSSATVTGYWNANVTTVRG